MAYPFVQAAFDYGPRKGPVLGFVVHMAEGGGTVGYLAGSPARGVSVHYVVERSGRVVQMLREDHASGSINPADLRTTDDPGGFYGVTAARAVLGLSWHDPNSVVISCEIEGFAAAGPNADQAKALAELVDGVRSRHAAIGVLGHRDFADYKPCPGRLIDWASLGGHGEETTMRQAPIIDTTPALITTTAPHWYELDNVTPLPGEHDPLSVPRMSPYAVSGRRAIYATPGGGPTRLVLVAPATTTPLPPPVVDCDDAVTRELAAAADRAAVAVRTRP